MRSRKQRWRSVAADEDVPVVPFLWNAHRTVSDSPDDRVFGQWYSDNGEITQSFTFSGIWAASGEVAYQLRHEWGIQKGDRAILAYELGLHNLAAFLGCLRAGVIAVPVYPLDSKTLVKSLRRLQSIVSDCDPQIVLLDPKTEALRSALMANTMSKAYRLWPQLPHKCIRSGSAERDSSSGTRRSEFRALGGSLGSLLRSFDELALSQDDIAFLEYSFGSANPNPKGIMVTFAAIDHSVWSLLAAQKKVFSARGFKGNRTVGFSWLPQVNGAGLIQCTLMPFIGGYKMDYMSPVTFQKQPLLWLTLMSQRGSHWSIAPESAFRICVHKWLESSAVERSSMQLKLGQVAIMASCAEVVSADTVRSFGETFGPAGLGPNVYMAGYGLAEHTSGLSWSYLQGEKPLASRTDDELLCCGHRSLYPEGLEVKVVDPSARIELPPGQVGELWVSSPSVAAGYWGLAELSERVFRAKLVCPGDSGKPFLRTGELACVDDEMRLFIVCRVEEPPTAEHRATDPGKFPGVDLPDPCLASPPDTVEAISEVELGLKEEEVEVNLHASLDIHGGGRASPTGEEAKDPERVTVKSASGSWGAGMSEMEKTEEETAPMIIVADMSMDAISCAASPSPNRDLGSTPSHAETVSIAMDSQSHDSVEVYIDSLEAADVHASKVKPYRRGHQSSITPLGFPFMLPDLVGDALDNDRPVGLSLQTPEFGPPGIPRNTAGLDTWRGNTLQMALITVATAMPLVSAIPAYWYLEYLRDLADDGTIPREPWVSLDLSFISGGGLIPSWGLLFAIAPVVWFVSYSAWALLVKWAVMGRLEPGSVPLTCANYHRWWFVNATVSVWETLGGHLLLDSWMVVLFYRLMGADVAWSARICAHFREFDLVKVESGASVEGRLHPLDFDPGYMIFGPIKVEAGARICGSASVFGGCTIGEGSVVEPLGVVQMGTTLCSGGVFAGNPVVMSPFSTNSSGFNMEQFDATVKSRPSASITARARAAKVAEEASKTALLVFAAVLFVIFTWLPKVVFSEMGIPEKSRYFDLIGLAVQLGGAQLTVASHLYLIRWIFCQRNEEGERGDNAFHRLGRWYVGLLHQWVASHASTSRHGPSIMTCNRPPFGKPASGSLGSRATTPTKLLSKALADYRNQLDPRLEREKQGGVNDGAMPTEGDRVMPMDDSAAASKSGTPCSSKLVYPCSWSTNKFRYGARVTAVVRRWSCILLSLGIIAATPIEVWETIHALQMWVGKGAAPGYLLVVCAVMLGPTLVFTLALTVVILKWIVIGNLRRTLHPDGTVDGPTATCWRWYTVCSGLFYNFFLQGPILGGTGVQNVFLRLMGARIAPDAIIFADVVDPDLIEVDAGCILGRSSLCAHRLTDRGLSFAPTSLGVGVVMQAGSDVRSAVIVEDFVKILSNTSPDRNQILRKGHIYCGSPAVVLRAHTSRQDCSDAFSGSTKVDWLRLRPNLITSGASRISDSGDQLHSGA